MSESYHGAVDLSEILRDSGFDNDNESDDVSKKDD